MGDNSEDEQIQEMCSTHYQQTVNDWFKLIRAALQTGLINQQEPIVALKSYLALAKLKLGTFPSETGAVMEEAKQLILISGS
ncbi:MAG: hypothetical protein GY847_21275 [Proteobacteria bacterium]|nr:hypothetical protein [Pseudomonadota bacterium]